jgi:hypothetical protein
MAKQLESVDFPFSIFQSPLPDLRLISNRLNAEIENGK